MASHLRSIAFISALSLSLGTMAPTSAQLSAGGGIAGYNIISADGLSTTLGKVMIIPDTIMNPPKGFDAGGEYWHWDSPSQAYPQAFVLVPTTNTTFPSTNPADYDDFDHLAFDLSDPHYFPSVYIDPAVDLTYHIYESDHKGNPQDTTTDAYFAFLDGGAGDQLAWARKDIGTSYLEAGSGEGLLFVDGSLPAKGSIEVVEAN